MAASDSTDHLATLTLQRDDPPRIMGVLNATPDSFSGDGLGDDVDALIERGLQQAAEGADILDVGGESTRPGAEPVAAEVEIRRVVPLVRRLAAQTHVPISIDTQKSEVARAALEEGATIVNDVSGLRDPHLAQVAGEHRAWLVLTHNRWTARAVLDDLGGYYPSSSQVGASEHTDPVRDVGEALLNLAEVALAAGVPEDRVIVDPGLGFGKTPGESLELLSRIAELRERVKPYPVLVGPSRKSFVGRVLGLPTDQRLEGTLACVALCAFAGIEVIRVHDVQPSARATRMAWAIRLGQAAPLATPTRT